MMNLLSRGAYVRVFDALSRKRGDNSPCMTRSCLTAGSGWDEFDWPASVKWSSLDVAFHNMEPALRMKSAILRYSYSFMGQSPCSGIAWSVSMPDVELAARSR